MLTQKLLQKFLDYNPKTGVFIWRVNRRAVARAGSEAGSIKTRRIGPTYRFITIFQQSYSAHRLAWFYMTGDWPIIFMDHKDGNGLNNKWGNLRLATASQNAANAGRYSTNTSGYKGVTFHKQVGRWQSQIKKDGKSIYLGLFDTPKEAHAAYILKAQELFGEFARWA